MIDGIIEISNNLRQDITFYTNNDNDERLRMTRDRILMNKYIVIYGNGNNNLNTNKYGVCFSNRLLLYIDYTNEFNNNNFLLIIMKNPSYFSQYNSDKAVDRIINYMNVLNRDNNYQGVFIMNVCTNREINLSNDNFNDNFNESNILLFDSIINTYNPDIIIGVGKDYKLCGIYNYLVNNHYDKILLSRCFNCPEDNVQYPVYCGNSKGGRCNRTSFFRPFNALPLCSEYINI